MRSGRKRREMRTSPLRLRMKKAEIMMCFQTPFPLRGPWSRIAFLMPSLCAAGFCSRLGEDCRGVSPSAEDLAETRNFWESKRVVDERAREYRSGSAVPSARECGSRGRHGEKLYENRTGDQSQASRLGSSVSAGVTSIGRSRPPVRSLDCRSASPSIFLRARCVCITSRCARRTRTT